MKPRQFADGLTYFGGAVFSFYVVHGERPALLELGISQTAPAVISLLRDPLNAPPATLVALHAHYDHAGGAARLRDAFPNAALAGNSAAAAALADPSTGNTFARAMAVVNRNPFFANAFPGADAIIHWTPQTVDLIVTQGDVIDTGGGTLEVLDAPGHSTCSIALFHRLFVSDACGMPLPSGRIWPTAFDNADRYLETLRRFIALEPDFVCPGHFTFFRETRARRFLEKSLAATENFFARVRELIGQYGPDEQTVLQHINDDYNEDIRFIQENILRYGNHAMIRQAIEKTGV